MKIEIVDEVAEKTGLSQQEMQEFLAISLYKAKKINGVQGGKILGTSEIEFHGLLDKYNEYVNYDIEDLLEDIETLNKI